MRPNFRRGQNERRIDIGYRVTRATYPLQRFPQENRRVGSFPFGIRGREKRSYIGSGHCSEQRIRQSMQQHIAVRMTTQAFRIRQRYSANLEWDTALELMRVPAVADAELQFPGFRFSLSCWSHLCPSVGAVFK